MRYIVWGNKNKRVVYGSKNLRLGYPKSYLLEPGDPGYVELQPGEPGYVPPVPAPKPAKKPFHRKPKPRDSNTPTTSSTSTHTVSIPYYMRPTSDGTRVTTSIDYRGTKTKAEIVAEIQARLTAANLPMTIENILRIHDEVIIDFGIDAWKMEAVGHIGHLFTGGGSSSDLQGPWTYQSMNLGLSCNLDDEGEARAEAAFADENLGHKGRVMPIFAKVSDQWTKLPNHYTAGKSVLVELGNRKVNFDMASRHKVQWELADGTRVDADDYGFVEGNRISARCPPPASPAPSISSSPSGSMAAPSRTPTTRSSSPEVERDLRARFRSAWPQPAPKRARSARSTPPVGPSALSPLRLAGVTPATSRCHPCKLHLSPGKGRNRPLFARSPAPCHHASRYTPESRPPAI